MKEYNTDEANKIMLEGIMSQYGEYPLELEQKQLNYIKSCFEQYKLFILEKLDEMAYENDDGYKVNLLINWDDAKKSLLKEIA